MGVFVDGADDELLGISHGRHGHGDCEVCGFDTPTCPMVPGLPIKVLSVAVMALECCKFLLQ